jgi:hypothetical protein
MKNLIVALVAFAAFTGSAMAVEAPLWTCNLSYKAKAKGFQVLFGSFSIKGEGKLSCISVFGETDVLPVTIKMKAKPLALRVAFGSFEMLGTSLNIGVFSNDPRDLLGEYRVALAQGSLGLGAGVFTAVQLGFPNIDFAVSAQVTRGLGVAVGLTKLEIGLDDSHL